MKALIRRHSGSFSSKSFRKNSKTNTDLLAMVAGAIPYIEGLFVNLHSILKKETVFLRKVNAAI